MTFDATLVRGTALVTASAALATLLSASSSWAACEPITARSVPDSREAYYIDHDGSGLASLGDMRQGVIRLQDADGTPIGAEYWLATVDEVDADGKPTRFHEVLVFVFDTGALFTSTRLEPAASFDQPNTTIVPSDAQRQVVGGTGDYAGARGTLNTSVVGLDFHFHFDVTCE